MTDVYDHAESNGPAAPFFEYAITSPWCDRDYLRLNRFWMDGDIPEKNEGRSPHELYQNVLGATISPAPHATYEYTTIIADENEDYVCFAGMWWVQENKLAYLEPLCTVPEHQHKGLAAAVLSRYDRIFRPLGAEIMTGGGSEFYKNIGYQGVHVVEHYSK